MTTSSASTRLTAAASFSLSTRDQSFSIRINSFSMAAVSTVSFAELLLVVLGAVGFVLVPEQPIWPKAINVASDAVATNTIRFIRSTPFCRRFVSRIFRYAEMLLCQKPHLSQHLIGVRQFSRM